MNKNRIGHTESQLRRVIKECVNKILRENNDGYYSVYGKIQDIIRLSMANGSIDINDALEMLECIKDEIRNQSKYSHA